MKFMQGLRCRMGDHTYVEGEMLFENEYIEMKGYTCSHCGHKPEVEKRLTHLIGYFKSLTEMMNGAIPHGDGIDLVRIVLKTDKVESRINIVYDDPYAYGALLAIAAQAIARAYAQQGPKPASTDTPLLNRVREGFEAELSKTTDLKQVKREMGSERRTN